MSEATIQFQGRLTGEPQKNQAGNYQVVNRQTSKATKHRSNRKANLTSNRDSHNNSKDLTAAIYRIKGEETVKGVHENEFVNRRTAFTSTTKPS